MSTLPYVQAHLPAPPSDHWEAFTIILPHDFYPHSPTQYSQEASYSSRLLHTLWSLNHWSYLTESHLFNWRRDLVPSSPKQAFDLVGSAMQVPAQEYPPEPLHFWPSEILPAVDTYNIESYPFAPQQPFYSQPSYASNPHTQPSGLADQLCYATTSSRNEPLYPPQGDLLGIPGGLLPSQHLASFVQPMFEPSAVLMVQEEPITENRSIVDHQVTANSRARFSFPTSRAKVRCRYCYKLFDPKPGNLNRHADRHAGIKRYKCHDCGEAKVTKDQAVIHYITHHMGIRLGHCRKASQSERSEAMRHVGCVEPATLVLETTWEFLSNLNAE